MAFREWHFRAYHSRSLLVCWVFLTGNVGHHLSDIYFHQRNADEHHAALELRDAVLRLRRDGAFVAVPLFRVNTDPIGPHPVGEFYPPRSASSTVEFVLGSYEIWCPSESFVSVYSYLALNRGDLRFVGSLVTSSTA